MQALFSLPEDIKNLDYVLATYFIELDKREDIISKASKMAVGQTIGTWVEVPGVTDEMREKHMGRVVNVFDVPPYELSTQIEGDKRAYLIQIGYPTINFGANFPTMMTTLLGNDASTSAQVKLVDIQMPENFVKEFKGPSFGIEGMRKIAGEEKRPLLMNMIKPCTGISPEAGAKIFYETALGGLDFIKDDELLSNPSFNRAADRVKAYNKASDAAYEKTGKRTTYICNVTDSTERIADTAKAAIEAGAKVLMVNFAAVGYSTFRYIVDLVDVPVLGHYATAGTSSEGINSGISSHISVGKLPRLAGADLVVMNTPYGGYPLLRRNYIMTAHHLTLPYYGLKRSLPIAGGAVHPGLTKTIMDDLGCDIMLASGGAVQGHPMGAAAGATAMLQSIEAYMQGTPIRQYAKEHKELASAIERFGVYGE